jgi:hypothetical protein
VSYYERQRPTVNTKPVIQQKARAEVVRAVQNHLVAGEQAIGVGGIQPLRNSNDLDLGVDSSQFFGGRLRLGAPLGDIGLVK